MTGITEMLQLQLSFIPDITSVSDSLQGKTAKSGTSATRYAMESSNSTTSVSALLLKFGTFEQQVAEKKMAVIHQYYQDGYVSVMRSNGLSDVVRYDPKAVEDFRAGVRILMSPENPVFRMALNDLVTQMWQSGAIDAAQLLQMSYLPASSPIRKQLESAIQQMQQRSQVQQQAAV